MKLKVNFFTIVRNGMPFIQYHWEVFSQLKCEWHWHVVEGGACLNRDTAWSRANGGRIPDDFHQNPLSTDGTTEYLDELIAERPSRITLYRNKNGELWDCKLEMIQAPLANIQEECLLWQIDCDEFWTKDQIEAVAGAFNVHPQKTAAWYWCNFYVSPNAVVSTRNCYSQNPTQEWLRTWHFKPGDTWKAHEPPTLVRKLSTGSEADIGKMNPLDQNETERIGAVFDHFAYVDEAQLKFKEQYYGYVGALEGWNRLKESIHHSSPQLLSQYFPWVNDATWVEKISKVGALNDISTKTVKPPMVLVDGIAFQFPWTRAICRVWTSILDEWVKSGFSKYVTVLDRGGTFPKIPGIITVPFDLWYESQRGEDAFKLEGECELRKAEVFISTYHSTPITFPSVALLHDFIPERLGSLMKENLWHEKKLSIRHASAYVCVSQNTANDLNLLHPEVISKYVCASHLGAVKEMGPSGESDVIKFRQHNGITKPYILLVGERIGLVGEPEHVAGYKNAKLLFLAMHQWEHFSNYDIVLVGGAPELEEELRVLAPELSPILIRPSDLELAAVYSGAVALIYPSRYEGFGLPVLEAMKCGCPVITTTLSALPEVGGDVPIYVDPDDVEGLRRALIKASDPMVRDTMIKGGLKRADKFKWKHLAESVQSSLILASESKPQNIIFYNVLRSLQARIGVLERHYFRHLDSYSEEEEGRIRRYQRLLLLKLASVVQYLILR